MTRYPSRVLDRIGAHAHAAWPREACGLVVADGGGVLRVRPARNLASGRGAFLLDPAALIATRRDQRRIVAIYHGHCDAPASFSAADRAAAMAGGSPAWPGVDHLVVSVTARGVEETRCYHWDRTRGDFVVAPLGPAE